MHYFFSITGPMGSLDEEGVDLPGDREAREQAVVCFGEFLRDLDGKLEVGQPLAMEVTDATRRHVLRLRLDSEQGWAGFG